VDLGSKVNPGFPVGLLLIGAMAVIAVIIAIALTTLMGKKPGQKVQQSYERTYGSQPNEWTKYYNKK
jgi:ABC-type dipeptide/oligopeptide/nickel transport system permease component